MLNATQRYSYIRHTSVPGTDFVFLINNHFASNPEGALDKVFSFSSSTALAMDKKWCRLSKSLALESGLVTTWLAPLDTKWSISLGNAFPIIPIAEIMNTYVLTIHNTVYLRGSDMNTYDGSAVLEFLSHDAGCLGPVHSNL